MPTRSYLQRCSAMSRSLLQSQPRCYASTSTSAEHGGSGRKPMIRFNAKSRSHFLQAGEPHPCAPDDIVKVFADFGKKPIGAKPSPSSSTTSSSSTSSTTTTSQQQQRTPQPSSSSSSKLPPPDFEEFFQAPRRLWQQPMLEDAEMEAIMSGGATFVQ